MRGGREGGREGGEQAAPSSSWLNTNPIHTTSQFLLIQYYYHCEPAPGCIESLANTPEQHSPIFAIMADGVPMFGQLGE